MITQLKFKNWRSLRDVTIDNLKPINVFIGANASGKSNIINGLRFWQQSSIRGNYIATLIQWGGRTELCNYNSDQKWFEFEFTYQLSANRQSFTQQYRVNFETDDANFVLRDSFFVNGVEYDFTLPEKQPFAFTLSDDTTYAWNAHSYTGSFMQNRWQILMEGFQPGLQSTQTDTPINNPYLIHPKAANFAIQLEFLQQIHSEKFEQLLEDTEWLLPQVAGVNVERHQNNLQVMIEEKFWRDRKVLSVSAGTARILAMLLPFFLLDADARNNQVRMFDFEGLLLSYNQMPGVVIIEEPDTALNPHLLGRFVELIRSYVEDAEYPRQVIFTTHNPSFLDYFQPDEVRVVERDEKGDTTVNAIPDHIKDIWLDKHTLGEVWMTRAIGGTPE